MSEASRRSFIEVPRPISFSSVRSHLLASVAVTIVALATAVPAVAQGSGNRRTTPIPITSLAGQPVAVLPMTLVIADTFLKHDTLYAPYADRRVALAWTDSVLGAALTERGPEVQWVLPPALRRLARRSPGMVKDPDALGQAVLRSAKLVDVPEPLRAELRNLVAVSGGRRVLVPAALGFSRDTTAATVRAELSLVLVDARNGAVLWRTVASGTGPTPAAAVNAALAAALPVDISTP